ncbi:hypothetical protein BC829DRAFT_402046, partial [Chytridium lagenaria]
MAVSIPCAAWATATWIVMVLRSLTEWRDVPTNMVPMGATMATMAPVMRIMRTIQIGIATLNALSRPALEPLFSAARLLISWSAILMGCLNFNSLIVKKRD